MKKKKPMRTVAKTWSDLSSDEEFQNFFNGYLKLLQTKFFKREVIGHNYTYSYYTCGQPHDPRNPKWKPFQHLAWYCEKKRFDFLAVKEIIQDRIGRELICECQLLSDEKSIRRMTLQKVFGADFGGPGRKDFDII